jgi:predicted aspartyl protease
MNRTIAGMRAGACPNGRVACLVLMFFVAGQQAHSNIPLTPADSVVRVSVRVHGRLLVPVSVNGGTECPFLFDTGANTTVVSGRLARKAGVRVGSEELANTFAGKIALSAGRVDTLRIGNDSVAGLQVLVGDLAGVFNLDPEVDGILGEDILSRFNYLIDRRGRRLEIDEDDCMSTAILGAKVVFERRRGTITVPVAGGALHLMLDSGNPYLVVYDDVALRLRSTVVDNANGHSAIVSSIGRRTIRPCRIGELIIGETRLRNIDGFLSTRDSGRPEDGFLPLGMFDSVYVNNRENFMVLNPRRNR